MKKEELIGLRTKEVKEILDKKSIRYQEDTKKKLTIKEPSGNIVEIKETDTGELVLYESNRKVLIFIIILASLVVGLTGAFGNGIYESIKDQIIEITGGIGAPELEAEEDWGKERIVKVVKDAKSSKKLAFYEYCVKEEKSKEECKWEKTYTKNTQVGKTGIWEVIFRGVDIEGKRGKEASKIVKVDNNAPDINSFKAVEIKETSIKVKTEAKDNHSGIEKYMYSLDGVSYREGSKEYTFNNLESGKEYRIYVKVIDKVGNESIVSILVRTEETKEEANKQDEVIPEGEKEKEKDKEKETEEKEWDIPQINLDEVPSVFTVGEVYSLPSYYDFGNDTGEVVCLVDGVEHKDTSTLTEGTYTIKCKATSSHGKVAEVEKEIRITAPIGEDEIRDGWIKLNLYYPDDSYDWEWRYGLDENNQTEEYAVVGWQDYTGPILIKIEDIPKIYIRYKMNGKTFIIPPAGTVLVDIQPVNNRVACGGVTSVNIQYDADALTKEYRINGGSWQPYTGPFTVNGNTIVEARATKNEDVYNNIGEFQFTKQLTGYDKVTITSARCALPRPTPSPSPSPTGGGGSTPSPSTTPTPSVPVAPAINLNGLTARMYQGDDRSLPSYYSYGSHGRGSIVCEDQNGNIVTNTRYLGVGTYRVTCTLTAADGATVTANTTFDIIPFTQDPAIDLVKLPSTIKEGDNYQLPSNYTYGTHGSGYVRCDDGTDPITNTRNLPVGRYVITCEVVAADGANASVTKNLNVTYSSMPYIDLDNVPTTINLGDFYSLPSNYSYGSVTTGTYICTVDGTVMNDTSSLGLGNHYIECNLTNTINQPATATKNINVVTRPTPAAPGSILAGPQITSTPSSGTLASSVDITITPQDPASIIYYRIGLTGTWQVYNGVFPVTSNATIYAKYIRQSDGKQSQISSYRVTNIQRPGLPYVAITTNPDVTQNRVSSTQVSITGRDYQTLEYSYDNINWIAYTGAFTVNQSCTVYAKATDQYGNYALDQLTIVLTTPPVIPVNLNVSIYANPDSTTLTNIVNETEITINYDPSATVKEYKIGAQGQLQPYTGPFRVNTNTTIYAYARSATGNGSATKAINFLTLGIADPIITANPQAPARAQQVRITINYDQNASVKMYRIDGGAWQVYTGDFYVDDNCIIEAYQEDILGNVSNIVSLIVNNIVPAPVYTSVDQGDYYLIRLNYPSISDKSAREYKWKENGTWKKYDDHGILLIKQEEASKYNLTVDGIEITDTTGAKIKIPMTHVYVLDVPYSELSENLFMRWDNTPPPAPSIYLNTTDPTREVEATIVYDKLLVERYYKIVEANGTDSGWLEYSGPIKITKNNTTIYAKGTNRIEIDSPTTSVMITNIDEIDPTLAIKGDLTTPRQKVTLSVTGNDNLMLYMVKWAKGSKNVDYFNEEKDNQGDSIKNGGTVTIEENGIYTFYAVDSVGNEIVQEVEVTNIDLNAPQVVISVLTQTYGTEAEIDIAYGDSVTKEYSIGNNTNYKPYTGMFKITSYDVASLANSDGTLTIYAKGTDSAGNAMEVSEIVYVLDLGMPANPTINAANSYPTLTKNGFIVENTITVNYDNTYSPITNEISLDNGTTWSLYTGNEHLRSGTIGARSRKASGLTVSSSKNISMPSDAIPEQTYDNSTTTIASIGANVGKTFKIDEEVQGRKVRIYQQSGKSYTVSFYNASNTLLNTVTATTVLASIQIPSGATKAIIKAGSAAISISHITLEEEKYDITGESILQILQDNEFENGYYTFRVNGQVYTVHMYNYNTDQTITANKTFGDVNDVATASTNANNMVIVKVNGNLTINSGVTVGPYYNSYGGPKGFTIYVTGKLTNNGTIDNSHGAKAAGQNVYLWKNASGSYETVPAAGGSGGGITNTTSGQKGNVGGTGGARATGGGGGGSSYYGAGAGKGTAGTSYSGGTGGTGKLYKYFGDGSTTTYAGGSGGGLLVIYANEYKNSGSLVADGNKGKKGSGIGGGGGGAGGSINIFTNQSTGINALGIDTTNRYNQILGSASVAGAAGYAYGSGNYVYSSAAGGVGQINIGKIINGTYIDLKTAINNDKTAYQNSLKVYGDSILSILNDNDLESGYHTFVVNGQTYTVHLYTYDGDQTFTANKTFGDANDVATASTNAQNMVIVKVKGNLTINSGVIVQPYSNTYGGPKGFTVFVTGTLVNNGTIRNITGAKAAGQAVHLWKNASGTYETVPAAGGGAGGIQNTTNGQKGKAGGTAGARTTGGGGGGSSYYGAGAGKGTAGTSYSGGTGGTGNLYKYFGDGSTTTYAGGAGGGLLIIYAKTYTNNKNVYVNGNSGKKGSGVGGGGGGGGGSLNIFYKTRTATGTTDITGGAGYAHGSGNYVYSSAAGGSGHVTYTSIDISDCATFSLTTTTLALSNSGFIEPTYTVTINYEENLNTKLYSTDGTNFQEYTGPITVPVGTTVYAKAKEADGTQKNTVSYKVNPISDMVGSTARDNNLETVYTQPANTTKMFTVKGLIDRQIRIYLSTVPGSNSKVTIYDKNGNSIGEQELTNGITFVDIDSKTSKIAISSGSSALGIKEINVRAEKNITTKESPVISTNSTNWTTEKTVTISYIDGYTNEYSLDLGTTWSSYTENITLSSNNVVIARAKDASGKIVASSSYTVTKIDNVEPEVTIDIDSKIGLGSNNILPTSYNIDTTLSGGTVECKDGNTLVTNTSELELGNHNITCTVTTGSGKKATVSKTINVVEEYEITFEDLDDLVANETRVILAGDKLGELPVIEKSGFIGWYKEQEYLEEISENTIPSSSTTYYAKYEEIPSGGE